MFPIGSGSKFKQGFLLVSLFCAGFLQLKQEDPWERSPDSFVPDEGLEVPPPHKKHWMTKIFVEDSSGVMKSIQSNIRKWEELEEYGRHWNLHSSGLYKTPERDAKRRYLEKRLLKYADKRLSGEIKRAEEGTTLRSIKNAHDALRPSAKAQLTKNVKLRLKARLLQGEARLFVENPYVDFYTYFGLSGETSLNMGRTISSLDIKTSVDYKIDEGRWQACIERPLSHSLKARVSSTQSDKDMMFSGESDQRLEFIFQKGF